MEFFEFADVTTTPEEIVVRLSPDALPGFCDAIEAVEEEGEADLVIYFLHWGRFHIRREQVMGGVRFSVPDCPNALAWTVTTGYPPCPEKIVVHATINRTGHDDDFLAATRALLSSFKIGLEQKIAGQTVPAGPRPLHIVDLRG
ncbi:MAG: hypothetical protein ACOY32_00965 [Thermodesulfobacteriota bacterium]